MSERETGKVKWFNDAKGFGFIERPHGEDLFVHFSSLRGRGYRRLAEGQSVDYVVTQGEKGPEAQDVGASVSTIPQRLRDIAAKQVATALADSPALSEDRDKGSKAREVQDDQDEEIKKGSLGVAQPKTLASELEGIRKGSE